jgi:TonB-linked SusC/RagA family outer membrane protein
MRKILLLGLMLLLGNAVAFAQNRVITGTVISNEDNLGVPGATVLVKGTTIGTATDLDGKFTLSVPENGSVLVVTFVGLVTQEITIGNRSEINVLMAPDSKLLSEVIVTGYGTQTKREITGAVASISGEAIQNLPLQSFDRALQGRAAGVMVQNASGIPGSALRVRIRGQGSINAGNDPLYIVDGVQFNNSNDASNVSTNPLASINPNDIETIEILKDAAASIYGSQAANGVVIITTKKGKQGKTQITFNTYQGRVVPIRLADMMDSQEFLNYRLDAFRNNYQRFNISAARAEGLARRDALNGFTSANFPTLGQFNLASAAGQTAFGSLPESEITDFINSVETFDWQDEIFSRAGRIANYELSARGGSDNTRFYISGAYNKQEGQIKQFDFERANIRFNIDHDINKKVTIEAQLNASTIMQNATVTGGSQFENPTFAGLLILPFNNFYNSDEEGDFREPLAGILQENPLKSLAFNERSSRNNQLNGSLAVNYKIVKGLTFRSLFGLDYRAISENRYTDPRSFGGRNNAGSAFAQYQTNTNFITTQQLNYGYQINPKNRLDVMLGAEYRAEANEAFSVNAQGFPTPQFRTIQSAAEPTGAGGFFTEWKNAGVFTNVKYAFAKKLYLNGTLRYDGSSRFGFDKRWGLFPSIGASYILTEEEFFKNLSFLDDLKVRASYGTAGNNRIGNFDSRGLVSSAGAGNYLNVPGLVISGLANNQLSWETQITTNFGVDFAIFEGRISGSVDVYKRLSKDLLLDRALPNTSGYGSISENVGELENRGIEIGINGTILEAGGFRWNTSFNIAFQDQELLSLFDDQPNNGTALQVGHPLNLYYGPKYAGVNPASGRPMFYDREGNITYQPTNGSVIGDENDDRVILGNTNSDFFGGWTHNFSYKGFSVEVLFQYDYGKIGQDGTGGFSYNPYETRLNLYTRVQDLVWREPGDITSFPRPNSAAEVGGVGTGLHRSLQDLSYIRLKQTTVAYEIPATFLSKYSISNARIYFQGINLWTLDNYTGLDVEFVGGSTTGIFPSSKNFTLGVQIGF